MATANFYLKPAKKNGLSPVLFVYQDKGKKFKVSTKVEVNPKKWTGKRVSGNDQESMRINTTLQDFEIILHEIQREEFVKGIPLDFEAVTRRFKLKKPHNSGKAGQTVFFELFDQFILDSRPTKCIGTIKHYKSTKRVLQDFEKYGGERLSFEKINLKLYQSYINYLIGEREMLNNTVGKYVKILKVFLNYVRKNGLTEFKINVEGFKVFKEDIDIIYLKEKELARLYSFEGLSEALSNVRDNFCFECFTGLRFSDIVKLRNENIKGDFIEFRTQKTRDSLFVPLNKMAKEILNKHQGKHGPRPLPPALSNQKTNFFLKQICEKAGIDEISIIEKFSGARKINIQEPKYKMISTHTGRRTFITLSHERGMPVEMIMKITGIKEWNTLKKYLKVSEKAKLLLMNKFWDESTLRAI